MTRIGGVQGYVDERIEDSALPKNMGQHSVYEFLPKEP